jgi:Protein of unknown function (DUF1682)
MLQLAAAYCSALNGFVNATATAIAAVPCLWLLLQMRDLRDFAAKRSIAKLPQSLLCVAESNELAQTVLTPAVVAALTPAAVHVQLIHLTDQVRLCSILLQKAAEVVIAAVCKL